ncbi:MAG: hypothetical protein R2932_00160 [Caldilineaceae bacterium]
MVTKPLPWLHTTQRFAGKSVRYVLLLSIAMTLMPHAILYAAPVAYVDPTLLQNESTNTVQVIVTAQSAQEAAQIVRRYGGEVQSELWLINAVSARLPQNQLVALSHAPRIQSVVQDSLIKTAADVKRTPNPMVWEVESPVSVEVGATELHGVTRTSVEEINGAGITVAVIDTGVAFNEAVVAVMGEGIRDQFKGQADFVGAETVACTHGAIDRGNYCWSEAIGYDKEFIRLYYVLQGYRGDGEPFPMPDEFAVQAAQRYIRTYELLTQRTLCRGNCQLVRG